MCQNKKPNSVREGSKNKDFIAHKEKQVEIEWSWE